MKFTPRLPGRNVNVSATHPLKEFAILAGGLLALAIGIYVILGLSVDLLVAHLSPALEKKLAGVFEERFQSMDEADGLSQSLQAMVDGIQERCTRLPYRITVHVKRSEAINAAALPGGHLVVFSGLLEQMKSENELAFVIGHELGHFAHRDHLRGLGRALLLMAASTALLGADNGVSDMIGRGVMLTELSFSRRQETQADEFALETLMCRYGHAADAAAFFQSIPAAADPGPYGHYFASHPENRRRIDHLNTLIRDRGYPLGQATPLAQDLRVALP